MQTSNTNGMSVLLSFAHIMSATGDMPQSLEQQPQPKPVMSVLAIREAQSYSVRFDGDSGACACSISR